MRPLHVRIQIIAAAALLGACSGLHTDDISIDEAELLYADGQYSSAQAMCDSLASHTHFQALSVNDLCRLSVLASQLADINDDDANIDIATRSMQEALKRQPDSVFAFVHSLAVDGQSRSLSIRQLTRSLDPSCEPDDSTHTTDIIDNVDQFTD